MKKTLTLLAFASVALWSITASAQTRTSWEMHRGLEQGPFAAPYDDIVKWGYTMPSHGNIAEYGFAAPIAPADDPGWGPAPNGDTIGFSIYSRLCGRVGCRQGGDFTYFQTFVNVPPTVEVTAFTIAFSGMDDGSRVSIINSLYPSGYVIPNSYVYLGGSGTTNLAPYVVSGEVNRVVITQVDDCCSGNNLHSARVVLNGQVVETDPDTDGDGVPDPEDGCPYDAGKIAPGACGCGVADTDSDGDGAADCIDGCDFDAAKLEPGICGCGVADTDSDGDGAADCIDGCPFDAAKLEQGVCGCGVADTDSDGDGTADCIDECPADPAKTDPGACGCFVPDTDTDFDGLADCVDACPLDPDNDMDGDGVCGDIDLCESTVLPEDVPTVTLGTNRWADVDGDGVFDTKAPKGKGPKRSYTIAQTAGCSCSQIIAALDLGEGHKKFGCSISAMDEWTAFVLGL